MHCNNSSIAHDHHTNNNHTLNQPTPKSTDTGTGSAAVKVNLEEDLEKKAALLKIVEEAGAGGNDEESVQVR
tara:strand:- start:1348 stop:1563 length:216 start_codon:yes stop_codon:yes gene_type:complete